MKVRLVALLEATCLAALAGGATVAAAFALMTLATGSGGAGLEGLIFVMAFTGLVAMFAYAAGTMVIGIPAFLLLNRAGWTTPVHASLAGAALSGLTVVAVTIGAPSATLAGPAAVGGAIAGLVFRKVAYSPD